MKTLTAPKLRVSKAAHELRARLQQRSYIQWSHIKNHVEQTSGKSFSDSALTAYLIEAVHSSLTQRNQT